MERDTAVALIKQKCGFRRASTLDEKIVSALKNSQEVLEKGGLMTEAGYVTELPWFLRKDDQELTLLAGENSITLPSDFIREVEDEGPWFPNTNGTGNPPIYLEKAGSGVARRTFPGSTSGPQVYQVRSTDLFIYPATDENLTLYWTYIGKDTALDSNIENAWLKWVPQLLIGHAGQGVASDLRDMEAVKEFSRLKVEGQKQLLILNVQREMSNRRTAIGRNK